MHFDKEHYLCLHPQCLSARFVVFDNDIDLRAHEINIHGAPRTACGGGTKIQLEFRVRRSGQDGGNEQSQTVPTDADFRFGLDGEVFVPEALPSQQTQQVNEPVITYGPHAERTAQLRAEAERLRQGQHQQEAFPSLASSEGNRSSNGASFLGWSAEGLTTSLARSNPRALTEQNFPSLQSTNPVTRNINTTGSRSNHIIHGLSQSTSSSLQSTGFYRNLAMASSNTVPAGYSSTPNLVGAGVASKPTPSFSATSSDFPSLSSSSTRSSSAHKTSSLRYDSVSQYAKKHSSSSLEKNAWASNNTAMVTSSTNESLDAGIVQVENMKTYLGPKYKQLKLLTRNFASNEIHAESYVDQALTLFDDGIQDEMFWYFVPNLIQSCPNDQNSRRAQQYLETLRLKYGLNKI